MIEHEITHHIQKHVLGILRRQKIARFRDLKKQGVDTNLFAYHLKLLVTNGYLEKIDVGYTLTGKGLSYVDRISEASLTIRSQPKITTMLVVQNSDGDILLWKRDKQPYIDTWTLPYGKIHSDDETLKMAATREAKEKLGLSYANVEHAGDCYVRVKSGDSIVSSTLMHIFRLESDEVVVTDRLTWARPHRLADYLLAPGVEQIITRTFFRDPFFFEEYEQSW